MSEPLDFSLIGKTINFRTNAVPILGAEIRNAKVLGFLDPASAKFYGDILAKHISVYPYLPEGTADDPYSYSYLKVALSNGTETVYGIPWVDQSSIAIVETTDIAVRIKNRGQVDLELVRTALLANGFSDFTLEVVNC